MSRIARASIDPLFVEIRSQLQEREVCAPGGHSSIGFGIQPKSLATPSSEPVHRLHIRQVVTESGAGAAAARAGGRHVATGSPWGVLPPAGAPRTPRSQGSTRFRVHQDSMDTPITPKSGGMNYWPCDGACAGGNLVSQLGPSLLTPPAPRSYIPAYASAPGCHSHDHGHSAVSAGGSTCGSAAGSTPRRAAGPFVNHTRRSLGAVVASHDGSVTADDIQVDSVSVTHAGHVGHVPIKCKTSKGCPLVALFMRYTKKG